MDTRGIESLAIEQYLARAAGEIEVESWDNHDPVTLFLVQGFEERSVGVIESLASIKYPVREIVIGKYLRQIPENAAYADRMVAAARCLTTSIREVVLAKPDSISVALASVQSAIVLDITGLSSRAMFGALDAVSRHRQPVYLGYAEAAQYWPTKEGWEALAKNLADPTTLPDEVEAQPWLFGHEHRVELVEGHEGRDGIGKGRALLGFLPFKAARLAAVLAQEEYEEILLVVGRPRLEVNHWRIAALRQINQYITKERTTVEMSTFDYRSALEDLRKLLFLATAREAPIMERYDVHLALLGSKLQDVACWVLSSLVPAITVVTSVPTIYFPKSFSAGIGKRWVIPLLKPT